MKYKWDSIYLGFIIGIFAPFVVMLCYWQLNFGYMTAGKFIDFLILGKAYTPLISLCVVGDLAAFFIFIWRNLYYLARGVLFATFVYAGLIFMLKFFT